MSDGWGQRDLSINGNEKIISELKSGVVKALNERDALAKENASLRASLKFAVEALESLGNSYVELYPSQLEARTSLIIAKIKAKHGEF